MDAVRKLAIGNLVIFIGTVLAAVTEIEAVKLYITGQAVTLEEVAIAAAGIAAEVTGAVLLMFGLSGYKMTRWGNIAFIGSAAYLIGSLFVIASVLVAAFLHTYQLISRFQTVAVASLAAGQAMLGIGFYKLGAERGNKLIKTGGILYVISPLVGSITTACALRLSEKGKSNDGNT